MRDLADYPQIYHTIVADPPWPYEGGGPVGTGSRGAKYVKSTPSPGSVAQYGAMSIDELCKLPVPEVARFDAHLYLWTTNSFLVEAHIIARAWGFDPKTIITWVKRKHGSDEPSMKTGHYYRGATEHCLFAVRGQMMLHGPPHPTVFDYVRLPHSEKPDYFYKMVEEQSYGPYLELFARRKREGWDGWGNQYPSD